MMIVKSDPTLLPEVRHYGSFDTNACYQCGSCTVVCDLTNDNSAAFPRRVFRYTLFGLRKPLLNSLEPWLCYYCGDCSTTCPRQTEPGEAMMTLRRYLTTKYDWTGISSKIYSSKVWELGALVFVGLLVLVLTLFYHLKIVEMEVGDFISMSMGMEHMFGLINTFTFVVVLLPLVLLLSNAVRMHWLTMRGPDNVKIPFSLYLTEAKTLLVHSVTQKKFRDCKEKNLWIKHLFLVSACAVMIFIKFFFLDWFQTDNTYSIYHPQRLLGYLIAGILIYTTGEIIINRFKKGEQIHKHSNFTDWTLPILLLLTAVSGLAVHIFRYLDFALFAHFTYAIHLAIAVPMLVIEIPFGKWSHMIYRPLAVYFQTIKEKAMKKHLEKEVVLDHAA